MATFVNETFTESSDVAITAHTGETGATWAKNNWNSSTAGTIVDAASDSLINPNNSFEYYYASGISATAEYDVTADIIVQSTDNFRQCGICARMDASAGTFYRAELDPNDSTVYLYKYVSGTGTLLGTYPFTTAIQTYSLKLVVSDAAKEVWLDGVLVITNPDNAITIAGYSGLFMRQVTTSTGPKIDNFVATDVVTGGSSFKPHWAVLTTHVQTSQGFS